MNSTYTNFDNYGLRYLPAHLHQSKKLETLAMLLLDINWLEVKLSNLGISELIKDYTLIENDQNIKLIHKALIKSISILDKDPSQWRSQLSGRLANYPEIQSWLEKTPSKRPWLKSNNETLESVDSMLVGTNVGYKAMSLAISPNDLFFVTGSADGEVKVWEISTLKSISALKGNKQHINSVAFTPDGCHIVFGSGDSTIKIWDWQNSQEIRTLRGHTGPVNNLYITKDGKFIFSGSIDNSLRIWDIKDGSQLLVMDGYKGGKIWVSPDMSHVIAGTKIWNISKNSEPRDLISDSKNVTAITEDGNHLVYERESQLVILDINSRSTVKILPFHQFSGADVYIAGVNNLFSYHAYEIVISPNGKFIIGGLGGPANTWHKKIILWNIENEDRISFLDGHTNVVNAIAITNNSRLAISLSHHDGMIKTWSLDDPIHVTNLNPIQHKARINSLAVSPNNEFIVSGGVERKLIIWNLADSHPFIEIPKFPKGSGLLGQIITSLDFKANGTLIVGTLDDEDVSFRNLGRENGYIYLVKIEPSNTDKKVVILNSIFCSLYPSSIRASQDGHQIIYSNEDGIYYIDLSKKSPRHVKIWSGDDCGIAISEDGKRAYFSTYTTLYEWDLKTDRKIREFDFDKPKKGSKSTSSGNLVTVSRNRSFALLGFTDGTIYAFNLLSGKVTWSKQAHMDQIHKLVMIDDRQMAVSVSYDQTLKVWNVLNGELLTVFSSDSKIDNFVVAPDNYTIIVSADDPPRILNLRFKDEKFL